MSLHLELLEFFAFIQIRDNFNYFYESFQFSADIFVVWKEIYSNNCDYG
jgi:hypothetical protein